MITVSIISSMEHERAVLAAALAKRGEFTIMDLGIDSFDALKAADKHPDVMLMDFCMGDNTCTEIAPLLKRHSPSTSLIALCSCKNSELNKTLRAGISGCLSKEEVLQQEGFDHLAASIHCVHYGGLYFSRSIKQTIFEKILEPDIVSIVKEDAFHHLFSPTDVHILFGEILGKSDNEIAQGLNINTGTLRNRINHIKQKTGLRNRTQMALFALSTAMVKSHF